MGGEAADGSGGRIQAGDEAAEAGGDGAEDMAVAESEDIQGLFPQPARYVLQYRRGENDSLVVSLDGAAIEPQVTWGTSPEMVLPVGGKLPVPGEEADPHRRDHIERALAYMGLEPEMPITDIALDKIFIGSCTNSRIEDLRAAAEVVRGKQRAASVKLAMVVPGSGLVKQQAEREGLDKVFTDAGFEWREPGCSVCSATNGEFVEKGHRCVSTTNRNFVGRQGPGARTHLAGPMMAAAAALTGRITDVRRLGG